MKKMLNKKGFTLVELLAVIVVLAIIMLVVADRVGDAMKQSRGDSLVLQVKSMQREIDKYCVIHNYIPESEVKKIVESGGLTYNEDAEEDGITFTATANKGSKFANIILPKNADNIISGTEEADGKTILIPKVTINTSCPIETTS